MVTAGTQAPDAAAVPGRPDGRRRTCGQVPPDSWPDAAGPGREEPNLKDTWTCSGTICVSRLTGEAATLGVRLDSLETLAVSDTGRVTCGKQAGFDTVRTSGGIDARDVLERSGVRIGTMSGDSAEGFGFRGEHGLAAATGVEGKATESGL